MWVGLEGGGEFRGRVEDGRRKGDCVVTCLGEGVRSLHASYYRDRPEGFTLLEREDGGYREGFTLAGRWDGLVREFTEEKVVSFVGRCHLLLLPPCQVQGRSALYLAGATSHPCPPARYKAGLPCGPCWVRQTGGGWLVGQVDGRWRLGGRGAYLYPDLETAYTGEWREGRMVRGRASRVTAGQVEDGVLEVGVKAAWGPERRQEEARVESLSSLPLLGDPYEERTVEVIYSASSSSSMSSCPRLPPLRRGEGERDSLPKGT